MLEILGALSVSAAAGMRVAMPLLIVVLIKKQQVWSEIPILKYMQPKVLLCILIFWAIGELVLSKKLLGQRVMQIVQLLFSPLIGSILPLIVVKSYNIQVSTLGIYVLTIMGGALALVIKLVEIGWFFRLRGLPIGVIIVEDVLSVLMVLFAFKAPEQGGLIAMLLLWISIRSAGEWRQRPMNNPKRLKDGETKH